jgi:ABC-2 type transport system ATP-binding protein
MFGFVGPNGAGKTTAMRIILGVLAPDAGEVRWRGQPMNDDMRRRVGYMPEDYGQTFPRTATASRKAGERLSAPARSACKVVVANTVKPAECTLTTQARQVDSCQ